MTTSETIRIVVVDDNIRLLDSLGMLISEFPGMRVIGSASSGSEAVAICGELRPDVVVMDVLMPGMNGIAATREIREKQPNVQVLLLSSYEDPYFINEARRVGAHAFLPKSLSGNDLVTAIRRAHLKLPGTFPHVRS